MCIRVVLTGLQWAAGGEERNRASREGKRGVESWGEGSSRYGFPLLVG